MRPGLRLGAGVWRWTMRELRFEARSLAPSCAALTAGFFGVLVALAIKGSVGEFLNAKSREILSADVSISSLRPLREEEIRGARVALEAKREAEEASFNTVARGAAGAGALVDVRAVSSSFPVYGVFEIDDGAGKKTVMRSAERLSQERVAWVSPDALAQLGLRTGEYLDIGRARFKIDGVAVKAPGASGFGGFAPRIFIGRAFVAETGLLGLGSQIFYRAYFGESRFAKATAGESASEAVRKVTPDPEVFVRTPDDSVQGIDRLFRFFATYLSAVAVSLLTLAFAAAAFCLRGFAQTRFRNAAVLGALGASRAGIVSRYVLEIALLSFGTFLAALVLAEGALEAVRVFAHASFPEGFRLGLTVADIFLGLGLAATATLSFAGPMALRLRSAAPRTLLSDESGLPSAAGSIGKRAVETTLSVAPMALALLGIGRALAGSWSVAFGLAGGLGVATVVGWIVGRVAFRSLFRLVRERPGVFRVAMASLGRNRPGTSLLFVALFTSCLTLNVIPHLLATAQSELAPLQAGRFPDYFLFNIPDGSLERLTEFAKTRGAQLEHASPMIIARWTKHNGAAPRDPQFAKFPARVSYRARLIPSERVVEGAWPMGNFDPSSGGEPEASVETAFAERNGVRIGDRLEFDVLGVPVVGRVTSLRRVRWTDFHPNFFVEFQTGALDDAPRTWLASLTFQKGRRTDDFRDLVADFPEMSAIDVGRALEKASETASAVAGPIQASAWAASWIAFLVLGAATVHALRGRRLEFDVHKLVGADSRLILRTALLEQAVLAGVAAIAGAGAGVAAARFIAVRYFELAFQASGSALALSIVVPLLGTTALSAWMVNRALGSAGRSDQAKW